jgi:hypothetical protein
MKSLEKLDLSVHSYMVVHGILSNTSKENIEAIKIKYSYKGDLFNLLISLPSWVNSYQDFHRQKGRPKIKKQLLTKTREVAEALETCLKYFSGEMRGSMRDHRNKKDPFGAFRAIENNLPALIEKCLIEELKVPTDRGGQKSRSIIQDIIWFLMQHYEHNVGHEAKCGWDECKEEHVGQFYQFMIEIKPILAEMKIELGEDRTVGQYSRELLTDRKKKRVELLSGIFLLLENETFFCHTCPQIAGFWMFSLLHDLYIFSQHDGSDGL